MFFFADTSDSFFKALSYSPKKFLINRLTTTIMYLFMQKDNEYIETILDFGFKEITTDMYVLQKDGFNYFLELVEDMNIRRQIFDLFHDYDFMSIKQEMRVYRYIEEQQKQHQDNEVFLKELREKYPTLLSYMNDWPLKNVLEEDI